jgi:hypothetical protein
MAEQLDRNAMWILLKHPDHHHKPGLRSGGEDANGTLSWHVNVNSRARALGKFDYDSMHGSDADYWGNEGYDWPHVPVASGDAQKCQWPHDKFRSPAPAQVTSSGDSKDGTATAGNNSKVAVGGRISMPRKQRLSEAFEATVVGKRLLCFNVYFFNRIARPGCAPLSVIKQRYDRLYGKPTHAMKQALQSKMKSVMGINSWEGFYRELECECGTVPTAQIDEVALEQKLKLAILNSQRRHYHSPENLGIEGYGACGAGRGDSTPSAWEN